MRPPSAEPRPSLFQNRWRILFFSVLSMVAVAHLLRLGRDLLADAGDLRGLLWPQARDPELRLPLHGERHRLGVRAHRIRAGGGESVRLPRRRAAPARRGAGLLLPLLAPAVFRIPLRRRTHDLLFGVGMALVAYGIALTVVPGVWTPFAARFTLPKIGWPGVFAVAIAFDLAAAAMAFLVLRSMKLPAPAELPAGTPAPPPQPALLGARKP